MTWNATSYYVTKNARFKLATATLEGFNCDLTSLLYIIYTNILTAVIAPHKYSTVQYKMQCRQKLEQQLVTKYCCITTLFLKNS